MKKTRQIFFRLVTAVCSVFLLAAVAMPQKTLAKTYRMKIQSGFPRGDLSMDLLHVFAESASKHSKGRIKIKVFADPEIVPGDQLFNAAKHGVLDMVQAMGGYWAGVLPVGNVEFALPLSFKPSKKSTFVEHAAEIRQFIMNSDYIKVLKKEYAKHGFYFLDIHTYGPVIAFHHL